jgi:hypothetical protein
MTDPRSHSLHEADEAHVTISRHHAEHAPPLGVVLESLRRQLLDAMTLPFFDEPPDVEMVPVTKRALTETGAATVVARKREPAAEAKVAVEVRCEHVQPEYDPADGGRYQVRASALLRWDDARGHNEREVPVSIREIEGMLRVDTIHLQSGIVAAIRSIGSPS